MWPWREEAPKYCSPVAYPPSIDAYDGSRPEVFMKFDTFTSRRINLDELKSATVNSNAWERTCNLTITYEDGRRELVGMYRSENNEGFNWAMHHLCGMKHRIDLHEATRRSYHSRPALLRLTGPYPRDPMADA